MKKIAIADKNIYLCIVNIKLLMLLRNFFHQIYFVKIASFHQIFGGKNVCFHQIFTKFPYISFFRFSGFRRISQKLSM